MKDHFVELGKKLGLEQLNLTLSAMQPQGKITATLHRTDKGNIVAEPQDYSKYEKLSAVPANVMMDCTITTTTNSCASTRRSTALNLPKGKKVKK